MAPTGDVVQRTASSELQEHLLRVAFGDLLSEALGTDSMGCEVGLKATCQL